MNALQNTPLAPLNYSQSDCQAGIIHVGIGAFHRAHQAVYINQLLGHSDQKNWGIIGINLRSEDAHVSQKLDAQGNIYTLKTLSPENHSTYAQVGSILSTIDWSKDANAAADAVNDENVHLITMTVTEGGYYLSETGELETHLPIVADAMKGEGSCIYAYLRASLNKRRLGCNLPITLLCCDNLRDNGHYLKSGFEQFVKACNDTDLLEWMATNVTFPCCMVDRITPRPDPIHAEDVKQTFGVDDTLTVMSESYIQWVVEDNFAGPMPDLARVGVELVKDVTPYEDAKIRILNGGHTILAYFAALKGYQTYDQGLADEELNAMFSAYETGEVIPAIGQSPINLQDYYGLTKTRFSNSNIADAVARICADGGIKFPIFILPTISNCYANGHVPSQGLKGIAAWYVFMCKVIAKEIDFQYVEPRWDYLETLVNGKDASKFVACQDLWGQVPVEFPEFKQQLTEAINAMFERFPVGTA
jgi:D-arabinitol 4-dehydrogenase